ncbi:hypothetical protein ACFONG_18675 [Uliginosibacterium paludis]|uniref:Uncharacterized protein n=1 Tax=Uliginosibacterium paludis TaxID=1615952 RepID=A0ABV2CT81_9RHOO
MPLYLVESTASAPVRLSLRRRIHDARQYSTRVVEALLTTSSDDVYAVVEASTPAEVELFADRIGLSARGVQAVELVGQSMDEVLYSPASSRVNCLVRAVAGSHAPQDDESGDPLHFERAYQPDNGGEAIFLYDTQNAARAIFAQERLGTDVRGLSRVEKVA